jgi:ribonuclease P protein component
MLKKENRLSTNFEFNVTRKHGKKLSGEFSQIFFLVPKTKTDITKTGIVVSKKIHKSAVKRNRVKRVFTACLKEKFDTIPTGLWIVIHPNSKSLKAKHEEICSDIGKTLSKISLT